MDFLPTPTLFCAASPDQHAWDILLEAPRLKVFGEEGNRPRMYQVSLMALLALILGMERPSSRLDWASWGTTLHSTHPPAQIRRWQVDTVLKVLQYFSRKKENEVNQGVKGSR